MIQIKNNNSKKDSLESVVEKERDQMRKTIDRLNIRMTRLVSKQKKLISCLTFIRKKLSSNENISINNLITKIAEALQNIDNG